jgi:hypothetical protein
VAGPGGAASLACRGEVANMTEIQSNVT